MAEDPVETLFRTAKIQMLLKHPFMGIMATRLINVEAPWCTKISTDGKRLYFNREFIKSLPLPVLMFHIGHQVLHCVLDHLFRCGPRQPKLWDMAIDYVANHILVKDHIGTMPEDGLFSEEFDDKMTSENVYEILKSRSVTIEFPMDDHLYGPDTTTDATILGDANGPPSLSQEEIEEIRQNILHNALSAAQVPGSNVPAGIRRMLNEMLTPKLNWRAMLDAHVRSSIRTTETYERFSTRSYGSRAILPSLRNGKTVKVWTMMDASGSTTTEMSTEMLSETRGIMVSFRDFELTVGTFDAEIYNVKEFTSSNIGEIDKYEVIGTGGTSFRAIFNYLREKAIVPERLVIFTDGLPNGNDWGDPHYCPTLFVIHGNPSIISPYGVTCHYESGLQTKVS